MKILIATFDALDFPSAKLRLLDPFKLLTNFKVEQLIEKTPRGLTSRMDRLSWADVIVT